MVAFHHLQPEQCLSGKMHPHYTGTERPGPLLGAGPASLVVYQLEDAALSPFSHSHLHSCLHLMKEPFCECISNHATYIPVAISTSQRAFPSTCVPHIRPSNSPGDTAHTRTPNGARSLAAVFVKPITACLEAA